MSEEEDDEETTSGTMDTSIQQWLSFQEELVAHSSVYANLVKEQEKCATSEALAMEAARRREYFLLQRQQREEDYQRRQQKRKEEGKVNTIDRKEKTQQPLITPNFWPYQEHYRTVLPKIALEVFRPSPPSTKTKRYFCDIGSAPGGMSAYLCEDLNWQGLSFSLKPKDGGFKMLFKDKPKNRMTHKPRDMSRDNSWQALLHRCDELLPSTKFDFVNLGITLHWRENLPKEDEDEEEEEKDLDNSNESTKKASEKEKDGTAKSRIDCPPRNHGLEMQQIIKNELLFALNAVKGGGSIMLVCPSSDHANTFYYLTRLLTCCCDSQDKKCPIRIIPTNKPTRNPVYVLVRGIQVDSPATIEFKRYLMETDVTVETYGQWLVSGWEEASSAFDACQKDLENLWEDKRKALRQKRVEAEQEYGP